MIVGIGDLLWDIFPDGRKVAGGAPFNFAFHCHQLGHPATIVSRVGDDDLGRELREEVRRLGLDDEYVQTDREHPTGTVRVTVGGNGQPSYEIVEGAAWDFLEAESVPGVAAVCFGTLGQRSSVSAVAIQSFVAAAPLRVFDVNLRQNFYSRESLERSLAAAEIVKVSEEEWPLVSELIEVDDPRGLFERASGRLKFVAITRGAGGSSFAFADSRNDFSIPGVPAMPIDTVGAGDAFTAAMVCLHLEGKPLRECARFANRYAARVCEHRGGTPRIDRREIESLAALDHT